MAFTFTDITTNMPAIDTTAFTTLAGDILDTLVNDTNSPFKSALDAFTTHIESSPELEEAQRAGLLADFLRDAYTQINQQAISSAVDILKSNEELKLAAYKTEADYNVAMQQQLKLAAETALTGKQELKVVEDTEVSVQQARQLQANMLELQAKLRKQYGYGSVDFATSLTTLSTSTGDGAIDKQIIGYDKANYKDSLKTIQEQISLLTNANAFVPRWLTDSSKLLVEMITDGKINYTASFSDTQPVNETYEITTVAYSAGGSTPGL